MSEMNTTPRGCRCNSAGDTARDSTGAGGIDWAQANRDESVFLKRFGDVLRENHAERVDRLCQLDDVASGGEKRDLMIWELRLGVGNLHVERLLIEGDCFHRPIQLGEGFKCCAGVACAHDSSPVSSGSGAGTPVAPVSTVQEQGGSPAAESAGVATPAPAPHPQFVVVGEYVYDRESGMVASFSDAADAKSAALWMATSMCVLSDYVWEASR